MSNDRETVLRALATLGCSDNGCVIRPRGGQGTNGGCRCIPSSMRPEERVRLREALRLWRVLAEAPTGDAR